MLMAKQESIRDVIAFPKVKDASCLMSEAPNVVDEKTAGRAGNRYPQAGRRIKEKKKELQFKNVFGILSMFRSVCAHFELVISKRAPQIRGKWIHISEHCFMLQFFLASRLRGAVV